MVELDILTLITNQGFAIGVSVFLLYKGYTQDQEYLKVLQDMKSQIATQNMLLNSFLNK